MVGRPDRAFERVSAKFPRELLERIDDFRYTRRIPSRAEAVRQLIEAGLEVNSPGSSPRASPTRHR
jgi:metal-responsive CopG/Arc/MetJ family transcriptional regulator